MKALILAGGLGTRLRPLTLTRPKHLLPVGTVPHIDHVLALLKRYGITDVVLLTSYLAEQFSETVQRASGRGLTVHVTHEDQPLGTAGALKHAEDFVRDETFVVFNGDILTAADVGSLVAFHREKGAEATLLLTPVEDPSAFGVVPTDESGRVHGFIEKPAREEAPTNLINAGVYVMEPSVLDRIPKGEVWSAERALFPGLVSDDRPLYARATGEYWMDVGTPEKYLSVNVDAAEGRLSGDALPEADDGNIMAPGAVVEPGARVASCCLDRDAWVGAHANVAASVLLPGARIEQGARVRNSILGEGASVAAGVEVNGETVADGDRLGG